MSAATALRFPLFLLLLALLSSCGFALRGTAELPAALQTLELMSVGGESDLQREVLRALRNSGVELVEIDNASRNNSSGSSNGSANNSSERTSERGSETTNENSSIYRLQLGAEGSSERTLSVNSNARAGEYELELAVQFRLVQRGRVVLGPESLAVTRVYLTDPGNAVAVNEEADLIRAEMRRELAQQILRRLQTAEL